MYILALLKKLKHSTVIVVHNFKDAEELDDLQSMIDSDIKGMSYYDKQDKNKFIWTTCLLKLCHKKYI